MIFNIKLCNQQLADKYFEIGVYKMFTYYTGIVEGLRKAELLCNNLYLKGGDINA